MDTQPYLLIHTERQKPLAERIAANSRFIKIHPANWKRFDDTMPHPLFNASALKSANVCFLASCDIAEVMFEEISMMYTLADLKPRSFKILLPYYATGTMERKNKPGEVATAETFARMIKQVAPNGPGAVPLIVFDIHALSITEFFSGSNISPDFRSGAKMLRERYAGQDISIAFPDEGARKRFGVMFQADEDDETKGHVFPLVICEKRRVNGDAIVTIKEGDVAGRDVIVVDDLVHKGTTQLKCIDALKAAGARSVSAYVTHPVFDNGSEEKFMDIGLREFVVTDTCPKAFELDGKGPFRVMSVVPKMVESIMR